MTRFKLIALALVAVFCVSAVAASSAFAKTGEFVGSGGASLAGTKFTGSSGAQILEATSGVNVKCETATGSGEILSKTSATFQVLFKGCKKSTGGTCHTSGAPVEEIIAKNLLVDVVRKVGGATDLLLTKLNSEIEFECASVKQKVRGAFLAEVGSTYEGSLHKVFTFAAKQTGGVQKITEFETAGGTTVTGVTLEADYSNEGFKHAGQEGETEGTLTTGEGDFI